MTTDQILIFAILGVTLVLFIWDKWRFDIVALSALLIATLTGLVPPEKAFLGLGHPAVVTVAAVLIISQGLMNAGVIDIVARNLTRIGDKHWVQIAVLCSLTAFSSGFMNDVGALALFMPVAIWLAQQHGRSPSYLLMPMAFSSLLGGILTMIGTPPNIIISAYRERASSAPFNMFDYTPVGIIVAIVGIAFISFIGWRFIPRRKEAKSSKDLFQINAYLTEVSIPEGNLFADQSLHQLLTQIDDNIDVNIIALVRNKKRYEYPSTYYVLKEHDILLIEADTDNLKSFLSQTDFELTAKLAEAEEKSEDDKKDYDALALHEIIITPNSMLIGMSANRLALRERFNINVLAIAREGQRIKERLSKTRFVGGDILLIQADADILPETLNQLGCLPLASRGLAISKPRHVLLAGAMFITSIALVAMNVLPVSVALTGCALLMVLTKLIPLNELYRSVNLSVIVLLAAMLPVGEALETTGGSKLIADQLIGLSQILHPALMIAVLMVTVMLLTNVINNAAAAILSAPVAISLAHGMNASVDPFLMAVCVASSCAFLTPIGHQSNTLVMAPGGYKFGDYWRMGLPLSILVLLVAVPAILFFWPLQ